MFLTDLTFDCLVNVFNFVPLKDQLTCVEVWPDWQGNVLLSHKQLTIRKIVQHIDDLSEETVFGGNGDEFLQILNYLCNVEELDVVDVGDQYQQQIVENISRERRKLRIIKLGRCDSVDIDAFKRMVDGVPQLEEFRGAFSYSNNTDDNVGYLLSRAKELHTLDLSGSWKLSSDVFKGVSLRLKALKARRCGHLSVEILDHILESSKDTLETLKINPLIPYSSIPTLLHFKKLQVVSWVCGPDKCVQPVDGGTGLSSLCGLCHLQKIDIRGCFHDEDIRGISRSWKEMRVLRLLHRWQNSTHRPSHDALLSLRHMTSIEKIELWAMKNFTDNHLEVFSRELGNLRLLSLVRTSVTGRGLRYLAQLPNIRGIWCRNYRGIFSSDAEKEEVVRVLTTAQREKGREFETLTSRLNELHLAVGTL